MMKKLSVKTFSKQKIWFYYTILFLCVGFAVFIQFAICGKTLICDSDGYLQYYPMLVKLKNLILNQIGSTPQLWSWDTGLGIDVIGNYAIILCDPFTYFTLLFSNAYLDIGYSIMVILKLYVAGLAMLSFLRYHKKSVWICLLGAIGYAFCSWALHSLAQEFFLNAFILFPLLILGIDRVDDRKSPIVLILTIMASVVTSLYFSYMSAVFAFLYIIIKYLLVEEKKTFKSFATRFFKFFIYAIIGGVFLAGPILVPVLYTLLQTSTGNGVDSQFLPNIIQILRFVPSFSATYDLNNYMLPGMSCLFILMIPAMVLSIRKKQPSIYLFLISAICVFFPFMQSFLNGLSYPSGRWCYMLIFFFIYATSDLLESDILHSPSYKKGVFIWLGILFANAIVACSFKILSQTHILILFINVCFTVFLLPCLFSDQSENKRRFAHRNIFIITLINITVLQFVSYWPFIGNKMNIYMKHGACYNAYETTALKVASSIQDNDFYRVDTVDSKGNDGTTMREAHTLANTNIYWQVPTISEYLSTLDDDWIEYNKQLGNSAGTYRRVCIYSNDNRSRMDFLQGVRYFLANDNEPGKKQSGYAGNGFKEVKKDSGIQILESPYKAGLGYVFNRIMTEQDYLKYSELEREQVLMQCAVLKDKDINNISSEKVSTLQASDIDVRTDIIPASISTETGQPLSGHSVTIQKSGTKLKVKPKQKLQNCEVYLVFENFQKELLSLDLIWEFQKKNAKTIDMPNKLQFLCNNWSYHPYENFSVMVSNTANQVTKRFLNAAGENQGIRGNKNYIVNLGYFDSFDGDILCSFGTIGNYTFDSINVVAVPIDSYQQQAQTLSRNRLKITSNEGDHLKGTVNAEKDGILYMSILYNPGWDVYIDGISANTYQVDTAFTGVSITAGQHDVELIYHPIGYPYSLLLFASGLALTVACAIYFRKKRQGGEN